ncbi:hypothetical protein DIRU0_E41614 [Diutina rugosa]
MLVGEVGSVNEAVDALGHWTVAEKMWFPSAVVADQSDGSVELAIVVRRVYRWEGGGPVMGSDRTECAPRVVKGLILGLVDMDISAPHPVCSISVVKSPEDGQLPGLQRGELQKAFPKCPPTGLSGLSSTWKMLFRPRRDISPVFFQAGLLVEAAEGSFGNGSLSGIKTTSKKPSWVLRGGAPVADEGECFHLCSTTANQALSHCSSRYSKYDKRRKRSKISLSRRKSKHAVSPYKLVRRATCWRRLRRSCFAHFLDASARKRS